MPKTTTESPPMAKTQKTFYLDNELGEFLDKLMEYGGSTMTRIVTAALLQYLFNGCTDDEEGTPSIGPDGMWMSLAVGLERGEISIGEIPKHIIEGNIEGAKRWVKSWESDAKPPKALPKMKESLKVFEEKLRSWNNSVEDYGGEQKAILQKLRDRYA